MISEVEVYLGDYEKRDHKVLVKTSEYLKQWLIQHICGSDREYIPHMRARGVK